VVHMEQKERSITRVTLSPNEKWLSVWANPASENFSANPIKRTVYQTVWEIATGQQIASAIQEYERAGSYRGATYHKVRDTTEGITKETEGWQDVRMQTTSQNSPDGRLKASFFSDEIKLSDTATGRVVNTIYHYSVVNDFAFSPNGRWVATASVDGKVRLWPLSSEDIIREACARLPRNLSQEEWKMYLGDKTNYRETCPGLPAPEK